MSDKADLTVTQQFSVGTCPTCRVSHMIFADAGGEFINLDPKQCFCPNCGKEKLQ